MAMRYLAIDLGDKRTGVAVGDHITGIVTPLEVIETASENERAALGQRLVPGNLVPVQVLARAAVHARFELVDGGSPLLAFRHELMPLPPSATRNPSGSEAALSVILTNGLSL